MEEFDNEKQLKELEKFLDGFEERLTEYVKNSHAISYQMGERADKRDVYENGKLDGWNAAIEAAAKEAENWMDETTPAKIRKLKK